MCRCVRRVSWSVFASYRPATEGVCGRHGAVAIDDHRGLRGCDSCDFEIERLLNKEMGVRKLGFDVHLRAGSQTFCITGRSRGDEDVFLMSNCIEIRRIPLLFEVSSRTAE